MEDKEGKIKSILIRIFEIKLEKQDIVRNQQYEKVAQLRDMERQLERTIYCLLYGTDDSYDYRKYDDALVIYFKENFNVDYYKSIDSYRQVIRMIKLDELGI